MTRTGPAVRYWFATLALGAVVAVAPAKAQSQNNTTQDRDADLTRQQLSAFDSFLDGHPELAEQLRKNPSLVNKKQFVENHPQLEDFLQTHPEIKQDLAQDPNAVMHQEDRYDRRDDQDRDRDRDRNQAQDRDRDQNRDRNDVTRGELANMDRFMDSHPEIAEQLRKDPALVDNKQFVNSHPALQQFLASHPGVAEEYKENPNAFMHQEERYDRRKDRRNVATMDRFMDDHPEIAEQLRKDPSLVDNKQFVNSHPALQQFLASHPGVSEEYKENPTAFMHQEDRFDRQEDRFDGRGNSGMHRDNDVTSGELSSFHEFLQGHDTVASELSKNPFLATNQEYVENHPALKSYLQSNTNVREQLTENPQSFVKSAQQFDTPYKGVPKPATTDPKMK